VQGALAVFVASDMPGILEEQAGMSLGGTRTSEGMTTRSFLGPAPVQMWVRLQRMTKAERAAGSAPMALKGGVWGCVGSIAVGHWNEDEEVSLEAVREWLRGCCVDIDAAGAGPRRVEVAVEGVSVVVLGWLLLCSGLDVVVRNELVLALTAGVVVAAVVVVAVVAGSIGALVVMVLVKTCCLSVVLHVSAMHHPRQHTPPHVPNNHFQQADPAPVVPSKDSQ